MVTVLALLAFAGLALAFGYPLSNGITPPGEQAAVLRDRRGAGPGLDRAAGQRYHVQTWVQKNAPKLVSFGEGLAKPALSLGKGAASLLLELFTIFILVLMLLLEGPKMRKGCCAIMSPRRAARYSRMAPRSPGRSAVTCWATS